MTLRTSIHITLTALVAAATAVPAFGASEPKNEMPFVRPAVSASAGTHPARVVSGLSSIVAMGEPKNQAPFTARYSEDPGYLRALREVSGGGPLRTLQALVLGGGGAPGQPARDTTGISDAGTTQPANHFQVLRDAV
jgi:hypothetical protein